MCGIAGFIQWSQAPSPEERKNHLELMSRAIAHRGPDEESFYLDDHLSLLFRRLSIIDLSGGQQPIWNEDQTVCVLVNGEIYNHQQLRAQLKSKHRFRTASDSEVVVHLYEEYGEKAFSRLNGMFSVVLFDRNRQQLILARDRLGIKPMYYFQQGDFLLFGSELKALFCHPQCPRDIAWSDFSRFQVQRRPRIATYIKGVEHLPGGHYAVFDRDRGFRSHSYWELTDYYSSPLESKSAYQTRFSELLAESVDMQMMSDVPLGVFLSGGIDSSLISCMASQKHDEVNCFTVVERTTHSIGDVDQAKRVAQNNGMRFHPVHFDLPRLLDDFELESFEKYIYMMDSPRFDLEWLFKYELHRSAKQLIPDLKVILLGQGADEFTGGYSHRVEAPWESWEMYIDQEIMPAIDHFLVEQENIPEHLDSLRRAHREHQLPVSPYQFDMGLYRYTLQHFNLWHEDRSSSFASMESRVPYLDHRLIELLVSVPGEYQKDLFWDKAIIRDTMSAYDASYPRDKRKAGFFQVVETSSTDSFLRSAMLKVYPAIREKYIANSDLVSVSALDELYSDTLFGNGDMMQKTWNLTEALSLLVFEGICNHPEEFIDRPSKQSSAIKLLTEAELDTLQQAFRTTPGPNVQRQWKLDTTLSLPENTTVLIPLNESEEIIELILQRDNKIISQIKVKADKEWISMMLEKMGRPDEPLHTVQQWTEILGISPQDFVNSIDVLVQNQMLMIVNDAHAS
jgi:asparagine synthase (glutamine-hydrolysing)